MTLHWPLAFQVLGLYVVCVGGSFFSLLFSPFEMGDLDAMEMPFSVVFFVVVQRWFSSAKDPSVKRKRD